MKIMCKDGCVVYPHDTEVEGIKNGKFWPICDKHSNILKEVEE